MIEAWMVECFYHLLECHWSHNQVQLSMAALPFYIQFSYKEDSPFGSPYKSNEQRKGSKICWSRLPRILHEDDHVVWAHTRECGQRGNHQLSWCPHLRSMFVGTWAVVFNGSPPNTNKSYLPLLSLLMLDNVFQFQDPSVSFHTHSPYWIWLHYFHEACCRHNFDLISVGHRKHIVASSDKINHVMSCEISL